MQKKIKDLYKWNRNHRMAIEFCLSFSRNITQNGYIIVYGICEGKSAKMILNCHANLKIEIFGRCYVSMVGMNIVIHSRTTPNQIEA